MSGSETEIAVVLLPGAAPRVAPEEYFVAEEKRIDGNPRQQVWLEYQDASGRFCAGLWSSEPGAWADPLHRGGVLPDPRRPQRDHRRFGHAVTVCAGDEFTIPAGFSGTWRVVETTLKRFVIHEAAEGGSV